MISKGLKITTSSNQRLREYVRLVAFHQTANTSGSQVATKEMKAFESFAFPLNESIKAPKHVLTKGLKLNFQKSLMTSDLHDKFTQQIFFDK